MGSGIDTTTAAFRSSRNSSFSSPFSPAHPVVIADAHRYDSPTNSNTCARCVHRSSSAAVILSSPNTLFQSANRRFVVTIIDTRSISIRTQLEEEVRPILTTWRSVWQFFYHSTHPSSHFVSFSFINTADSRLITNSPLC